MQSPHPHKRNKWNSVTQNELQPHSQNYDAI